MFVKDESLNWVKISYFAKKLGISSIKVGRLLDSMELRNAKSKKATDYALQESLAKESELTRGNIKWHRERTLSLLKEAIDLDSRKKLQNVTSSDQFCTIEMYAKRLSEQYRKATQTEQIFGREIAQILISILDQNIPEEIKEPVLSRAKQMVSRHDRKKRR